MQAPTRQWYALSLRRCRRQHGRRRQKIMSMLRHRLPKHRRFRGGPGIMRGVPRRDQFSVNYYKGGYKLFTIEGDGSSCCNRMGKRRRRRPDDITVLSHTPKSIYLVATSAMDFFCGLDALDHISSSGRRMHMAGISIRRGA